MRRSQLLLAAAASWRQVVRKSLPSLEPRRRQAEATTTGCRQPGRWKADAALGNGRSCDARVVPGRGRSSVASPIGARGAACRHSAASMRPWATRGKTHPDETLVRITPSPRRWAAGQSGVLRVFGCLRCRGCPEDADRGLHLPIGSPRPASIRVKHDEMNRFVAAALSRCRTSSGTLEFVASPNWAYIDQRSECESAAASLSDWHSSRWEETSVLREARSSGPATQGQTPQATMRMLLPQRTLPLAANAQLVMITREALDGTAASSPMHAEGMPAYERGLRPFRVPGSDQDCTEGQC